MPPRPAFPVHVRPLRVLLVVALALGGGLAWPPDASARGPATRTVVAIHWGAEEFPGTAALDAAVQQHQWRSVTGLEHYRRSASEL